MRILAFALTIITSIFFNHTTNAQTVGDAVRYSNFNSSGTARTAGVANSFGSMGGDFGVISINPAGLADFRKSEFMFSLSLNGTNTDAYLRSDSGNITSDKLSARLNLDNIGVVFSNSPRGSLKTSNIAIGLNQLANFNEQIKFEGTSSGSLLDRFVQAANGVSDAFGQREDGQDIYESDLAYNTGAIYNQPGNDLYYDSDYSNLNTPLQRGQTINRSGKANELSISWAGNFNNKFGIGAGIGIPIISFEETKDYFEFDPNDDIPTFNRLEFGETLSTSGLGINMKLGVNTTIARILRLGLAFHTPTLYSLTDNFNTDFAYVADTLGGIVICNDAQQIGGLQRCEDEPELSGEFKYSLTTPMKLILSAGGLFNFSFGSKSFC